MDSSGILTRGLAALFVVACAACAPMFGDGGSTPKSAKLVLESGSAFALSPTVRVTLAGARADEMYFTNTPNCAEGGAWEPLAATRTWDLDGYGVRSLYAKFRRAGQESECVRASIEVVKVMPQDGNDGPVVAQDFRVLDFGGFGAISGNSAGSVWIAPSGAGAVTLDFSAFGLGGCAALTVLGLDDTVLATYDDSAPPIGSQVFSRSQIVLRFVSTACSGEGFEVRVSSTPAVPSQLKLFGVGRVVTGECAPYSVQAQDDAGNAAFATSPLSLSWSASGDLGVFADAGCTQDLSRISIEAGADRAAFFGRLSAAGQSELRVAQPEETLRAATLVIQGDALKKCVRLEACVETRDVFDFVDDKLAVVHGADAEVGAHGTCRAFASTSDPSISLGGVSSGSFLLDGALKRLSDLPVTELALPLTAYSFFLREAPTGASVRKSASKAFEISEPGLGAGRFVVDACTRGDEAGGSLIVDLDANYALRGEGPQSQGCSNAFWTDLSGNLNGGNLVNFSACDASSGWQGDGSTGNPYRLVLDGVDDYLDLSQVPVGADVTFEFWIKPSATQGALAELLSSHDSFSGFALERCSVAGACGAGGASDNELNFVWGDGSAWQLPYPSFYSLNPSAWQHLVVTKSGSASTVYRDGVLLASGSGSSAAVEAATTGLLIGNWAGHDRPWKGELAAFRTFNRALGEVEIKTRCQSLQDRYGVTCAP